jgi:hypothetical protein
MALSSILHSGSGVLATSFSPKEGHRVRFPALAGVILFFFFWPLTLRVLNSYELLDESLLQSRFPFNHLPTTPAASPNPALSREMLPTAMGLVGPAYKV